MDSDDTPEVFKTFNDNTINEELKKVAEIELNERESETVSALGTLKDLLRSK